MDTVILSLSLLHARAPAKLLFRLSLEQSLKFHEHTIKMIRWYETCM